MLTSFRKKSDFIKILHWYLFLFFVFVLSADIKIDSILSGSLVITSGRVLRLRMEETASSRGDPTTWGLGDGLTTPVRKRTAMLRNITQGLGLGRILWNDLSNGKWT
jgi:hypothetical protein